MSNRNKTNRQQGRRPWPRNIVSVTIDENGKKRYTYRQFRWFPQWLKYADTIKEQSKELAFFDAISKYGCYEIEPTDLQGEALDYFNNEVRPELDSQHEIMRKGGRV